MAGHPPKAFAAVAAVLTLAAGARPACPQAPAPQQQHVPAQQQPQQPQQQPSFPAEVELVTVDVVVTDRQGRPVRGLTAADFAVREDGERQGISSFEAIELPAAPPRARDEGAPAERPRVSTNANTKDRPATGRTFVIVYDNRNLTLDEGVRAKAAVAQFLEKGVREGDRVLLVASEGDAWWSAQVGGRPDELVSLLKRLDGRRVPDLSPERITPWEAMRIHVYRDEDVAFRVLQRLEKYNAVPADGSGRNLRRFVFDNPYLTQRAAQVYQDSLNRNRTTLELLDRIMLALEPSRGRKAVLLVSGGFIYDTTLREFKRVPESARRSNVVLYFLDARGLEGMPVEMTAQFGMAPEVRDFGTGGFGGEYYGGTMLTGELASEGAQALASESGGFTIKNSNDLSSGINRIAAESQAYYLLGYRPTNTLRDGRFRKIEVAVARGGTNVRARKGYYAGLEDEVVSEAAARDRAFQRALDSPYPSDAIPLRMSSFVFHESGLGKASVLVACEVDVSGFDFEARDGRLLDDLQYLLVVAHRESGEHFRHDENVELRLSPATRESLARSGYLVARPFELAPGGWQAKIVVRDRNGGRVGSLVHDFEVPKLDALRTSTPLLTDQVQPGAERPRPVLRVRRTFTEGSTLYCEYEVYGAALAPGDAQPHVVAGYEIRRTDGGIVSRVEPTPIRPSSIGKVSRLVVAPLWRVPPGQYQLVLRVEDQLAGRTIEVPEPFEVAAGS
jgi:VWFA-related protein